MRRRRRRQAGAAAFAIEGPCLPLVERSFSIITPVFSLAMQLSPPSFPAVWTPDGCVVVGGRAAPTFAERKQARIFTGPFFASKERSSSNALQAWNEITNAMAPQAGAVEQSVSSSVLSTASSAMSASRTKFGRENITVHMHKFHERARRIAENSSHDALHLTALDGALGLTEAFFACKEAIDALQQPSDVEVGIFKEYAANRSSPAFWFHRLCPVRHYGKGEYKFVPLIATCRFNVFLQELGSLRPEQQKAIASCMNVLQHMIEVMAASTAAARQEKLHAMVNVTVKNEAQRELNAARQAGISMEIVYALQQICNIAFCNPISSIDSIVNAFCDQCGCERELRPLLLFVLDNHFGGKSGSSAADACDRRLAASVSEHRADPAARDNVIEVIMKMIRAAFSRDDPISKLRLCARDLLSCLEEPLVPFIMLQSLPLPRNLSSFVKDEGLGVAAAVLAAVMPRAIMSAHFIAELNTADLLSAGRLIAAGWGGLDIVGDMLVHSQLMSISDEHLGFPDAISSIQAAESMPILIQQISDHSKRREVVRDMNVFARDVMRALLCRSCALSLRTIHALEGSTSAASAKSSKAAAEALETAVEACIKLHTLAESDVSASSSSAKFSREIMALSLRGAVTHDFPAATGFSSPRRARPSAASFQAAIDCVHRHCQFACLECSMCLRVGHDATKLECGHRLCSDCVKGADKAIDGVVSSTPRKALGQTASQLASISVVCPDCRVPRIKVSLDGPQKRLPLQFACMLRLRALKREVELVNFIRSAAAVAEPSSALPYNASLAAIARKRIQAIVEGGKDDLLDHRSPFALQLLEHVTPQLLELLVACDAAADHAPDVYFVSDATVRAILAYINAPLIAAHHADVISAQIFKLRALLEECSCRTAYASSDVMHVCF